MPRRTRRLLQRKIALSLAGAALLVALGQGQAIAATIDVGGGCSLIDAITAANTDMATGGCSAGSGADTIVLPANNTHTLTIVNNSTYDPTGLPVISTAITIDGNRSTITRDPGAASFWLLTVSAAENLKLKDTTIRGGVADLDSGGGIVNLYGQLTLEDCTVTGNTADRGGGLFSRIGGSTSMTLSNSTISNNTAYILGSVLARSYDSSSMSLSNSTISGNTAVTSGGGVWTSTTDSSAVKLNRNLITGDAAPSGTEVFRDYYSPAGTFTADNFNLFGHSGLTNAQAFSGFTPGANDLTATSDGSDSTALTDILDTILANNGGPTLTHALVVGSPALDASPVDADCPATDQRGVARPQGVACDIGAFEVMNAPAEVCNNCLDDDGDGKIDLADDECSTNPLTVTKGSFTLKPDPSKDQILLTAKFPSAGVTINPPVDGVTLSFFDADGGIECFVIPPNSPGWKVNGTGPVWSFKDLPNNSLGDPQAKEKVKIRQNGATFDITLDIKEAEVLDPDAGLIASGIVIGEQRRLNQQPWQEKSVGKKFVTP